MIAERIFVGGWICAVLLLLLLAGLTSFYTLTIVALIVMLLSILGPMIVDGIVQAVKDRSDKDDGGY